ncbi:Uncharacterised protein [uncultured archaeon]|nr:Uncharacterised protein [uncultured archaeon]
MPAGRKKYTKIDGEVIFVDESGNPGLLGSSVELHPYYAIGFVYCRDPSQLRTGLKRLLKREHERKRYPLDLHELKFYLPNTDLILSGYKPDDLEKFEVFLPSIRAKAIKIICNAANGVFAAVIDKKMAKQTWTAERIGNFAFAQTLLLDVMNNISPQYPPAILYDRGRLSTYKTKQFEKYIAEKDRWFEQNGRKLYNGEISIPISQNSYNEPGIWAADMVAGAFQCKYKHCEPRYAELLKIKYINSGERLYWPEK